MGLLSKLFLNSRLKFTSKTPQSSEVVFQPQLANHQFDKENIRFIIFRDHDLKGRSVLFDSLKDGISDQTKISRSSSDLKKLADMMFGTLPLSNKTTTFKVHSIKSPPQLMITKVFIPQPRSRESTYSDLDSFDLYSIESLSTDDHIRTEPQEIRSYPELARQEAAHSMPMDVPLRAFGGAMCHADDMELLTSASGTHSPGAPSGGSVACLSSSYSSKDRRMRRHKTTMIHLFPNSRNEDKIDVQNSLNVTCNSVTSHVAINSVTSHVAINSVTSHVVINSVASHVAIHSVTSLVTINFVSLHTICLFSATDLFLNCCDVFSVPKEFVKLILDYLNLSRMMSKLSRAK